MIDKRIREEFLKQLEETGNIFRTCKRVGISCTSTVYRWAEKNKEFKKKMEEAQRIGRLNAIDVAEGGMVLKAAEGDFKSQSFLLRHLSPHYKPDPKKVFIEHARPKDVEEEFENYVREQFNLITDGWRGLIDATRLNDDEKRREARLSIKKNAPPELINPQPSNSTEQPQT